ncbi:MAG: right-handed parallel beta-helix repeat-containing protein [Planctomycetota bacterium]
METQKVITVTTVALVLAICGSALGTTYYVKTTGSDNNNGTSWETAFATIEKGVDSSTPTLIKVAGGTYTLTSAIDVDVVVTIEGGYDSTTDLRNVCNNETIIDGDRDYRCLNITAAATIDGVTMIKGEDPGDGHQIYCSADATIRGCVIRDSDHTTDKGGGIYNYRCSPKIYWCVFADNEADYGGAMYNYYSSPDVNNCVFYNNYCDHQGAGICNYESSPTITNCTFFENDSEEYGGGIYNEEDSDAVIYNCIFWGNDADVDGEEIYNDDSDPTFGYCCIRGGLNGDYCDGDDSTDGGGNISSDPLFSSSDEDGADNCWATCDDGLSLSSSSPCIDAGDNSRISILTDLCGGPRKVDDPSTTDTGSGTAPIVDMGAYEYDPS